MNEDYSFLSKLHAIPLVLHFFSSVKTDFPRIAAQEMTKHLTIAILKTIIKINSLKKNKTYMERCGTHIH